jgi:hypothetical protein
VTDIKPADHPFDDLNNGAQVRVVIEGVIDEDGDIRIGDRMVTRWLSWHHFDGLADKYSARIERVRTDAPAPYTEPRKGDKLRSSRRRQGTVNVRAATERGSASTKTVFRVGHRLR